MKKIFTLLGVVLFMAGCAEEGENNPYREYPAYSRSEVSGTQAAVVSGHPLATAAGYEVLRRGGNATDAAVTMAAVLAVTRPHMNGIGGDAFALFYDANTGIVSSLNGSGRAGELATSEFFRERDLSLRGAAAITVPGALSAWDAALERYGTITLAEALEPAIYYAEEGFPVTPTLHFDFDTVVVDLNEAGRDIYTRNGEPLEVGERLRNPALARTLYTVTEEGSSAFYGGSIGEKLAEFVEDGGGYLRLPDFATHRADWTDPISISFREKNVHVHPPNTQGIALLMQLVMAEEFDLEGMEHNSAGYIHSLVEINKLAFADRNRWVADFETNPAPVDRLLDREYLQQRAREVTQTAATEVSHGFGDGIAANVAAGDGDTVYLMVVDKDGNAVSWIQSLFASFGSKLVEPETGIVLHNRGAGFTLREGHPNQIAPGKRPFHTLTPALVTDENGNLEMTIGSPGGHGQTQFKLQVLHNIYVFGMHPQAAVEAARYRMVGGTRVDLESRVPVDVREELRRRGHDLRIIDGWREMLGGFQVIFVDHEHGVVRTGADPRREANAIAY